MIDNILSKKENFNNYDNKLIDLMDGCVENDLKMQDKLNFQTATNIPLSPNYYKNHIGHIYTTDNHKLDNGNIGNVKNNGNRLTKNKLLYDGIWESKINIDTPFETQEWNLTNGNIIDGYYYSNKLLEINKPFPTNFIDNTTLTHSDEKYYMYFNDEKNDKFDIEIECFPSVFSAGIINK